MKYCGLLFSPSVQLYQMSKKENRSTGYSTLLFFVLMTICHVVNAQRKDSITVDLNRNEFAKGDSINIEVNFPDYRTVANAATVQLWIENTKTGTRWKFRYPLINGYLNAKLKVDSNIQDGIYAFNFLLQKSFFTLKGHTVNAGKKDNQLNYVIISKSKQTLLNKVPLDEKKSFLLRNLLFQDSAFIIFSKPGHKNNDLLIDIKTPLDSAFEPIASCTKFIVVGKAADGAIEQRDTASYVFNTGNTRYKIILPEVVIKTKSNKKLEDFEKENVSGNFLGEDAIVFDGLNSDEIANAPDLYFYLSTRIGGLQLITDNETGNRSFTWRGQPTDLYLNEIKLDTETPFWINPSDIAMIKIFRPGTVLSSDAGAGGAIAIYTKTGEYKQATNRNYSFYILGYTGIESTWK